MKVLVILATFVAFAYGKNVLGSNKCTWGPSYWCSDLSHAKECQAMEQCMTEVWNREPAKIKEGKICRFCQFAVTEARNMLAKKGTEEEIITYLQSACSVLPDKGIVKDCKHMMLNYIPEVTQLITSEIDAVKVCQLLGLCSGPQESNKIPIEMEVIQKEPKPIINNVGNKTYCENCEKFFMDVQLLAKSNSTIEEFEKILDNAICSRLGGLQGLCKVLVQQYAPDVLDYFANELKPTAFCNDLGMCPGMFQSFMLTVNKIRKQNDTFCNDCHNFFIDFKAYAISNGTEEHLEAFIDKYVCDNVGPLKGICETLVKQYAPELLSFIVNELDPKAICVDLTMCDATRKTPRHSVKAILRPLLGITHIGGAKECDMCKAVASELQKMDRSQMTQETTMKFVKEQLCARLGEMAEKCSEAVDQYSQELFELLATELDPLTICQFFGFCGAEDVTMTKPVITKTGRPQASTECVLCEFVMKEIDDLLAENATEAEITAALDKVCGIMPETIRNECIAFVNQYAPAIIELLIQEADPKKVCTIIGLCAKVEMKHVDEAPLKDEICEVCKVLVNYLDEFITENSTVDEMEKLLDKICNFLPTKQRDECLSIVKEYGLVIAQLIRQEADPSKICEDVGACSAKGNMLIKPVVKLT